MEHSKQTDFRPRCQRCGVTSDATWCNECLKEMHIESGIRLAPEHAQSLQKLVEWFKVVITKRAEPNTPLTLEYCDELIEALKTESQQPVLGQKIGNQIFVKAKGNIKVHDVCTR